MIFYLCSYLDFFSDNSPKILNDKSQQALSQNLDN